MAFVDTQELQLASFAGFWWCCCYKKKHGKLSLNQTVSSIMLTEFNKQNYINSIMVIKFSPIIIILFGAAPAEASNYQPVEAITCQQKPSRDDPRA